MASFKPESDVARANSRADFDQANLPASVDIDLHLDIVLQRSGRQSVASANAVSALGSRFALRFGQDVASSAQSLGQDDAGNLGAELSKVLLEL
jgi:hypothetical protein